MREGETLQEVLGFRHTGVHPCSRRGGVDEDEDTGGRDFFLLIGRSTGSDFGSSVGRERYE